MNDGDTWRIVRLGLVCINYMHINFACIPISIPHHPPTACTAFNFVPNIDIYWNLVSLLHRNRRNSNNLRRTRRAFNEKHIVSHTHTHARWLQTEKSSVNWFSVLHKVTRLFCTKWFGVSICRCVVVVTTIWSHACACYSHEPWIRKKKKYLSKSFAVNRRRQMTIFRTELETKTRN